MGTLRLLLALSVAYGHFGSFLGFPLVPGDTAVESFYAVSGFYMTLVLNEKYPRGSFRLFLSNRFLRLFPVYMAVTLAAIALALAARSELWQAWAAAGVLSLPALGFIIVTQAIIFAQDFYAFLCVIAGNLVFTSHFETEQTPLLTMAPIPQSWTLGVELWFYLLAPLVVRRGPALIVGLIAASLALRLILQFGWGLAGDPWSYRFFPSELALFLAGALAYHVYRAPDRAARRRLVATLAAVAVAIGVCLVVNRWNGMTRVVSVAFLVAAIMAVPFLFRATKSVSVDRYAGELSYPLYLCHLLVASATGVVLAGPVWLAGWVNLVASVLLAAALYHFIDAPVDRWRQRRAERTGTRTPPATLRPQEG